MQLLPEHEEGQPARARWVLAIPEALHAAWLPGIEEFLGENHNSPPSKNSVLVQDYNLIFFVLYERSQLFVSHASSACDFICTWHPPGSWSDGCFLDWRATLRCAPCTLLASVSDL